MKKEKRQELKKKVDTAGRMRVSEMTGIRYSTLGPKLNGFVELADEDVNKIENALSVIDSVNRKCFKEV